MIYERITQIELNSMSLENGVTPNYTYEDIIIDEDTREITYINLIIHKTAQEVYQEHLNSPMAQPNEMEVRLGQIEDAVGILATQVAKNTLLNGGLK